MGGVSQEKMLKMEELRSLSKIVEADLADYSRRGKVGVPKGAKSARLR
jgi:hypothetical protein